MRRILHRQAGEACATGGRTTETGEGEHNEKGYPRIWIDEMKAEVEEMGEKAFRAGQIYEWLACEACGQL